MEVLKTEETENGGLNISMSFTQEEINELVDYALKNILKEIIYDLKETE